VSIYIFCCFLKSLFGEGRWTDTKACAVRNPAICMERKALEGRAISATSGSYDAGVRSLLVVWSGRPPITARIISTIPNPHRSKESARPPGAPSALRRKAVFFWILAQIETLPLRRCHRGRHDWTSSLHRYCGTRGIEI